MRPTSDERTAAPQRATVPAPLIRGNGRRAPFHRWIRWAAAGDILAAGVASITALLVRFGWSGGQQGTISYPLVGLIATSAWPLLLAVSGAYELRPSLFGVEELRRVLRSGVLFVAGTGVAHIAFRLDLSRGYFSILVPVMIVLTAVLRSVLRMSSGRSRRAHQTHHRAVAVGPAADIDRLCHDLARTRSASPIDVVAYVADDIEEGDPAPEGLDGLQRLPDRSAIQQITTRDVTVDLLVRAGRPGPEELWVLGQRAHDLGVTLAVAPHRADAAASVTMSYVPLGSTPLLMVETPTLRPVAALTKGIMDRGLAAVFLVLMAPALALIAATVAIRDGRPVLFRQERVGRHGKTFRCLKFRTMRVGSEDLLPELLERNEVGGPLFKLRDDPRVTKTGRWLRRHSLDELPQFVNVLTGDMSIVGPRPPLPHEVATYDVRTGRRLLVKPGITGLWQTEGRSNLPWDDGVYLDLLYVDQWSPLLDLVIMARTAKTIIRPEGAY